MDKTTGARRRQLLAAVSVLGVSLGMAESAHADATQTSNKTQRALKIDIESPQHSVKYGGQSSYKEQASHKTHSSIQWGHTAIKGETNH